MTDEQILKLAKTCGFDRFQRRKYDGESDYGIHWECWEEQLLKFAQEIRQQTIDEILTLIKDVPNPEVNRTAIKRILNKYYD
jgi:hypothetical protein